MILDMSDRGNFLTKDSGTSGLTTCKLMQWNFTAAGPVICDSTRPNLTGKIFNFKEAKGVFNVYGSFKPYIKYSNADGWDSKLLSSYWLGLDCSVLCHG